MNYPKFSLIISIILLIIVLVLIPIGIYQDFSHYFIDQPEPVPEKSPISFHFQDFLIVPETIGGFHIQEWPVASYDSHESIYEVQLLIKGVGYTRGPVFDTRDKAERVMIWLGLECGL